jgi:DNA-binding NarL/FixJ family response regulator
LAQALAADATFVAPQRASHKYSVLIVEGQTAERTILTQLVQRDVSFIPAGEAAGTEEALQILTRAPAPPDVIVLSWLQDGGAADRWGFVDELRRRCPDARFVMTCPKERSAIVRRARENGIDVLHASRDSFHSLRRAMHLAAQGRPYLSPRLEEVAGRTDRLTKRHREILVAMAEGASRPEIGRQLGISEATVRSHSRALFATLGVNERAHAVAVGLRAGLIG